MKWLYVCIVNGIPDVYVKASDKEDALRKYLDCIWVDKVPVPTIQIATLVYITNNSPDQFVLSDDTSF